jgi:hypothetical protein
MLSKFTDFQLLMAGYFILIIANIGQFSIIVYTIGAITRRLKMIEESIDNLDVDVNHRINQIKEAEN